MEHERLTTPSLRVAMATAIFLRGEALTIRQLSERLGTTPRGARYLAERLSAVIPIYDDGDGTWRLLDGDQASR